VTPKEFEIFCFLLEKASQSAYVRGHHDGASGKPLNVEAFKLTKAHRLTLKTEIKKILESR
jgi:hypothetical protein